MVPSMDNSTRLWACLTERTALLTACDVMEEKEKKKTKEKTRRRRRSRRSRRKKGKEEQEEQQEQEESEDDEHVAPDGTCRVLAVMTIVRQYG